MSTYAVVATGGKQYKLTPGQLLDVELIAGEAGSTVKLAEVLAARGEAGFKIGQPTLQGTAVVVEIVGQVKGPKVINFKFKRRKGYHRKIGHRQNYTRLKVLEIISNGAH